MSSRKDNEEDIWSSSDDEDDDEEIDCDDNEDDADQFIFYSICSYTHKNSSTSPKFDTLALALQYDISNYGFDLLEYLPASTSDEDDFFESTIKLINKCRTFVKDGEDTSMSAMELGKQLHDFLTSHEVKEEDDMIYYKPLLEDDSMLMSIDEIQELKSKNDTTQDMSSTANLEAGHMEEVETTSSSDSETINKLQSQIALLEEKLAGAKKVIASLANDDDDSDEEKKKLPADNDSYYFNSYSNTCIHETMLRDTVRTSAYEKAILSNSESLFRGKTVLDIGCGTAVLSLFCAKAGAKKVIAVDNSDIINQAKQIVKLNGYEDVICCVRGKMETLIKENGLPLLDGETVDIIVSEWMGYALFFETMLPSVMAARDAIMTPVMGTMFPNVSKIYIEGGNDNKRLNYWDNVHSLNMAPMKERMVSELTKEAEVEVVDDKNIVTNRAMMIEHDLNKCTDEELDFEAPFELYLRNDKSPNDGNDYTVEVHQLVVSFDIDFSVPGTNVVNFSTGCQSTPTHWKQTVLWFDPMHNCPVLKRGDTMKGTFRMKRNHENHRSIDMAAIWEIGRTDVDGNWCRSMNGLMKRSLIA